MRTRLLEKCATALSVIFASCAFPRSENPTCDDDPAMCPQSSRSATVVGCDCKCTLGLKEVDGTTFDGRVDVCLPAGLNVTTASHEQQVTLQALQSRDFDQRVFRYCSREVARFLRTTIRSGSEGIGTCALPVDCQCSTQGATRDTGVCHSPCAEARCNAENCPALLWQGSKLDASECYCSRAEACGTVVPSEDEPGLCRDWLTPLFVSADAPAAQ